MIEIKYKCKCCDERVVHVPPRLPGEDIADWMNLVVQAALYLDHRTRSPQCTETTMEYAKIPMTENQPLGSQPSVN